MAKILVVGKYYYPFQGGIEDNTKSVCETLAKKHDVTVLVFNHEAGEREEHINGVRVIRKKVLANLKSQPVAPRLFSGISIDDYDAIHFHSPNPFANALFLWKWGFSKRPPVIVTHHMDIYGRKFLRNLAIPFLHLLVKNAKTTIITSKKNLTISADLPNSGNYTVIPLSIDPDDFVIDESIRKSVMNRRKALYGDAKVIGFLGRHARYKGLTELVEAISGLPDIHLLIAGDGPLRQNIETRVRELGLTDRVHFLGRVSHEEKLELFASIDAFVFPSTEITEAFGISQIEAMFCKTPVVSSNLPTGVTDVAIDGRTAILAEPGDVESLREKIRIVIEDADLSARLRQAGHEHVAANMIHEVTGEHVFNMFDAVISGETIKGIQKQ
ncbi:glycosyltransferase [uncultured Roseibium sp.]|uniref:glycosyltransferase n=1 Tax=uncultured Roseibium sp. TaxID=1936171 RepID=UPI0032175DD7